jgi:hypothetical protein
VGEQVCYGPGFLVGGDWPRKGGDTERLGSARTWWNGGQAESKSESVMVLAVSAGGDFLRKQEGGAQGHGSS